MSKKALITVSVLTLGLALGVLGHSLLLSPEEEHHDCCAHGSGHETPDSEGGAIDDPSEVDTGTGDGSDHDGGHSPDSGAESDPPRGHPALE